MPGQATGDLPVKPPVAENLRSAQAGALLSNRELAQALEITERLLGKWRSGEGIPSWPNLVRLGKALDRDPAWFYVDHSEVGS